MPPPPIAPSKSKRGDKSTQAPACITTPPKATRNEQEEEEEEDEEEEQEQEQEQEEWKDKKQRKERKGEGKIGVTESGRKQKPPSTTAKPATAHATQT